MIIPDQTQGHSAWKINKLGFQTALLQAAIYSDPWVILSISIIQILPQKKEVKAGFIDFVTSIFFLSLFAEKLFCFPYFGRATPKIPLGCAYEQDCMVSGFTTTNCIVTNC